MEFDMNERLWKHFKIILKLGDWIYSKHKTNFQKLKTLKIINCVKVRGHVHVHVHHDDVSKQNPIIVSFS